MNRRRAHAVAVALRSILGGVLLAAGAAAAQSPHEVLRDFVGRTPRPAPDPDALAAQVAQRAPGYAGVVEAADGELEVLLTPRSLLFDADGRARDWRHLASPSARLARQLGAARLRRVDFDAAQLTLWKDSARPLLAFEPVHFVDIDETANRLVIGIGPAASTTQEASLRRHLLRARVPARALAIVRAAPSALYQQLETALQFQIPPLAAGAKIARFVEGATGPAADKCTLAAAALRNGNAGYLTASHCSAATFGLDVPGSVYRVIGPTGAQVDVGHEAVDPEPLPGSCKWRGAAGPRGLTAWPGAAPRCRYADASFVAVAKPQAVALGKLLLTPPFVFDAPQAPVASATRDWGGTLDFPLSGSAVAKTGMRTGTSHGTVTRTCVDLRMTSAGMPTNELALCQWKARLFAWHGDSGAPIFVPMSPRWAGKSFPGAGRQLLVGLLSAGPLEDAPEAQAQQVEISFSPWGSIAAELGGQWKVTPP